MSPEKRRAGRAIRKSRRDRQRQGDELTKAFHQFNVTLRRFVRALIEAIEPFFILFATPRRQNAFYWRRISGASSRTAPRTGDPSQTGVEALRSPHSAFEDDDPFEGVGTL